MKLVYREFGQEQSGTPLILLHGLLGSLVNWQRIARALSKTHRVIVPDLRNHGRSPHDSDVSYETMAADVLELLDNLGMEQAIVAGHSMGGKTAMVLALQYPHRVARLAVVDIAPVAYTGSLASLLDALLALPLEQIENRVHANALLAGSVAGKAARDYMLQNLQRTEQGWRWRNNLRALRHGLDIISAFPEVPDGQVYTGKTVFIAGEHSSYIAPVHLPRIRRLFPQAKIVQIAGAGHWVYAEQPQAFQRVLRQFLADQA